MHCHVIKGDFPLDREGRPYKEAEATAYFNEWFPAVRTCFIKNLRKQSNVRKKYIVPTKNTLIWLQNHVPIVKAALLPQTFITYSTGPPIDKMYKKLKIENETLARLSKKALREILEYIDRKDEEEGISKKK